jgi:plasmid maintenance system antidote protein VapI
MSKFRRYLTRRGEGAVKELAEAVRVSHAQISRIADGHRGASLKTALALSSATGLPPQEFLKKDVTTPKGRKARPSHRGGR